MIGTVTALQDLALHVTIHMRRQDRITQERQVKVGAEKTCSCSSSSACLAEPWVRVYDVVAYLPKRLIVVLAKYKV